MQRARTLSLLRVLTQRLHFKCLLLTACVLVAGTFMGHCASGRLRPTSRAQHSPGAAAASASSSSSTSSSSSAELLRCESATYMFLSSAFAVLFYLLYLVE